jgi:uncharacterized membrane protein YagU involved in acid resistance
VKRNILTTILSAAITGAVLIDLFLGIAIALRGGVTIAKGLESLSQWDASNFLGAAAFQKGWPAAGFGFCCHLVVTIILAAIFVLAARRWKLLTRQALASGAIYGAIVMFVMRYAVVPLGRAHEAPYTVATFLLTLVAHVVFFGVPVALVTKKLAP